MKEHGYIYAIWYFALVLLVPGTQAWSRSSKGGSTVGWRNFPSCDSLYARFGAVAWQPTRAPATIEPRVLSRALKTQSLSQLEEVVLTSFRKVKDRKECLVKHFLYGKRYTPKNAIKLFFDPESSVSFKGQSYLAMAKKILAYKGSNITDEEVKRTFTSEIRRQLRERRKPQKN